MTETKTKPATVAQGREKNISDIYTALKLPRRYRVHTSVDGYIGNYYYRLRVMRTETHGQMSVFALSHSWGTWAEINGEKFGRLADQIVHGLTEHPAQTKADLEDSKEAA